MAQSRRTKAPGPGRIERSRVAGGGDSWRGRSTVPVVPKRFLHTKFREVRFRDFSAISGGNGDVN
jgi:hypothetical protein